MRDEDIHRDAAVLAPKKRSLKDGATAARRGGALMLGCGVPATATFSTGKRTSDDLRRWVRDGARVSTRGRGGGTTSRSPTWTDDPIGGVRTWKPRRARGSRRDARGRRYAHARGRRESRRGWRRWTAASCEWPVVVRVAPLGWAKISDGHHKRRNCICGPFADERRGRFATRRRPRGARRLDNFIFFQVAKNGA